jgi:hypothetical protein
LQNVCGRYWKTLDDTWKTLENSPVLNVMLRKNGLCINSAVLEYIGETGFSVVESVTIRICRYVEGDIGSFNNSCEKVCTKVRNNILVCKRFNLSLPGRICIAKTMLYSQLNYFQYFIDIPQ